jgi:hypothetical protein
MNSSGEGASPIREVGRAAELVRKGQLEQLHLNVRDFSVDGSLADTVILNVAFNWRKQSYGSMGSATLVDAFLAALGIDIKDVD